MRLIVPLALIGVAFVLQAQITGRVAPGPTRPDLLLAAIVLLAVFSPGEPPLFAALVAGILEGVLCGMYMGAFITSRIAAVIAASYVVEPFNVNMPVAIAAGCLASMVCNVVFLLAHPDARLVWWLSMATRQVVVTAILVACLYPLGRATLKRNPSLSD